MRMRNDRPLTLADIRQMINYDPETGVLTWVAHPKHESRDGTKAGYLSKSTSYWCIEIFGREYKIHRLGWLFMTGAWPKDGYDIDHINQNKADNRFCNLREATRPQNRVNSKRNSNNTSGCTGVQPWFNKWRVKVGGAYVGLYDTFEEAVAVRHKAAKEVYGKFANHD